MTGVDFTSQDPEPMLDFSVNPVCVSSACYALYLDQFEAAKITEDDLDDLLGPDEIAALREEVTQQMSSFSSFWKILSTEMAGLQSGSTSLVEKMAGMKAAGINLPEVPGPSS